MRAAVRLRREVPSPASCRWRLLSTVDYVHNTNRVPQHPCQSILVHPHQLQWSGASLTPLGRLKCPLQMVEVAGTAPAS